MKLYERFSDPGFHTSIATTFCMDFDAYESLALSRLRSAGCTNNLVVMDAGMMSYALDTAPVLPEHAGRYYTLSGVSARGVFHPKLLLQLGRTTGRLVVGSANLTAPGLAGNLEVVGAIQGIDASGKAIIASAWRYLSQFLDSDDEAVGHQLEWMRRRTSWLFDADVANEPVPLSEGGSALFVSDHGAAGVMEQFLSLVEGDVRRLVVVSPYWDEDLNTLRELSSRLNARETVALIDGTKPLFPVGAMNNQDRFRLHDIGGISKGRFVHAKIVIAQTASADHVLFGSANCTSAAMGKAGLKGLNHEACLYRRMEPGYAISGLGLRSALLHESEADTSKIVPFARNCEVPLDAATQRSPGRFAISGGRFLWWPSKVYRDGVGVPELLDSDRTAIDADLVRIGEADGRIEYAFKSLPNVALLARVWLGGDVSSPVPVAMVDYLRGVVRDPRGSNAKRAIDRLGLEDEEGLWLLEIFDLISMEECDDDVGAAPRLGPARHVPSSGQDDGSFATLTYDQFMAGRKLRAESSHSANDLQGSDLSLVRQFLNRALGMASADVDLVHEAGEMEVIAREELDDSDEVGRGDGDDDAAIGPGDRRKKTRPKDSVTVAAREQIVAAVHDFNDNLREKASERGLTSRDVLRLRVMLTVVLAAGRPRAEGGGAAIQVLPPTGNASWILLIGKMLFVLFGGNSPAVQSLQIPRAHEDLPVDVIECWASALWAVNACKIALLHLPTERALLARLQELSDRMYRDLMLRVDQLEGEVVMGTYKSMTKRFADRLAVDPDALIQFHGREVRGLQAVMLHGSAPTGGPSSKGNPSVRGARP